MANEIHLNAVSGDDWYFIVRNGSGQVAYLAGEVFETWGAGGRDADDYDVTFTDKLGDHYVGDFPTWIAAGVYYIQAYKSATPSYSDDVRGGGVFRWDGSSEITDAQQILEIDTIAEMSAGAPPAAPTPLEILNYLYRYFRNKKTTDAGPPEVLTVYADDGSTPLFDSDLSDDGTVFTKNEFAAP